ncbi:nucleotidyltransferase family protein [Rhodothermus profundi]|uniref:Molybdenum cofactor cytidylyltransferase n=1 Tax=Rhodothermus profundi TaxID=633813 RepID=A0A1M6RA15_9BACT|nr:nucleotidyltransferase family protein [Rhodothermus profundi]SHK29315.1 molybdenum cofactor cytidylyltransferase [Rhodothermus profundi]
MNATGRVVAIVLAAGSSRRMGGRNKLLLPFGDQPLVRHVVTTILDSQAAPVVVVLGYEAAAVREALANLPVAFVYNPRYAEGMTTSIQAGVAAAPADAHGYMICLSDLPLIEASEYDQLIEAFQRAYVRDPACIIVPEFNGQRGNPVLFAAYYRKAILSEQRLTGCRGLVQRHPEHVVRVAMATDHILQDLDTPEAFEALRRIH